MSYSVRRVNSLRQTESGAWVIQGGRGQLVHKVVDLRQEGEFALS